MMQLHHALSLLENLAIAIIKYEKIETTLPKAKELRGFIEKLITRAGKGDAAAMAFLELV